MNAPRCEPPPEHRGVRWHWLVRDQRIGPEVFDWDNETGRWWRGLNDYKPNKMAALGFRYLAPAIPPEVKG